MKSANLVPLCFILSLSQVESVTKTWIPNTNYDNPGNWDLQRVPCPADRAIFPSQLGSAVALRDGSTIMKEIVLPSDGEIILPITGSLVVTGERRPQSDCPGEDVVFTRNWDEAWLDPANWKTEGRGAPKPVPHLDRIPCTHDRIQFPPASSFRVRLPEVPVTVGSISLLGQDMSPSDWEAALVTDSGELQFVSSEGDYTRTRAVEMTGEECADKMGCACAGHSALQDAVCKYTRDRDGDCYQTQPPCVDPVKPLGHCCPMCGSYLLLDYTNPDVGLELLQTMLQSFLQNSQVVGYIGKTPAVAGASRRQLQVVLVDEGEYKGDCIDVASGFAEKVRNNQHFGVTTVTVHSSGGALSLSKWSSVLGMMFGTLVAAVLAMGLIYFVFIGYHNTTWALPDQRFVFARFENAPSESEEALESRVEVISEPPSTSEPQAAAFDNPMFGNTKMTEKKNLPPAGPGHQVTHENPVYSALKRREDQEREDTQHLKEEEEPLSPVDLEEIGLQDTQIS